MSMSSSQIDTFSSRLNNELAALNWADRNELLVRIGKMELRMRSDGQERPVWKGPVPEHTLLGADVVVPTDQGERRGRVICFGVMNMGTEYERSVVIHVPSSGTQHEAAGSVTRLASPEDSERIRNEMTMAGKLAEAAAAVQRGPTPLATPERAKRRGQKDPKLIERMLAAAAVSSNVRAIEEGTSNHKIVGLNPANRIYVFKNQLRVDLSGFSVDHPGIRRISDEEARDMHLGKVRGQFLFDDREVAFAAFELALLGLAVT